MVTHLFCCASMTFYHRYANNTTLQKHQQAISFLINSCMPHSEWQHLHNAVRLQMIWKNLTNHIFRLTSIWILPLSLPNMTTYFVNLIFPSANWTGKLCSQSIIFFWFVSWDIKYFKDAQIKRSYFQKDSETVLDQRLSPFVIQSLW